MPKLAARLSPEELASRINIAKPLQPKQGTRIAVGVVKGLHVNVKGNSVTWVLSVRSNPTKAAARRLSIGLGPYSDEPEEHKLTYRQAIRKAENLYDKIRYEGHDPIAEKRAAIDAHRVVEIRVKTFKDCADEVVNQKANELTNAKALAQWQSTLINYVHPFKLPDGRIFGEQVVGTLTKHDVAAVLKPIWSLKPETARRICMRVKSIFTYAKVHDYFTGDNPATNELMKGLLGKITKKHSHHAAMPYVELPKFMSRLRAREEASARALELLVLTGTRFSEVVLATWCEFDLEAKVWTIPAERMKGRKEHVVPLTHAAVTLLELLRRYGDCDYVFVSEFRKKRTHYSNGVFQAIFDRMSVMGVTAHGFRSTFRDWAGETTHHAREVIEHALAHRLKDRTEAAYARSTLLAKRRVLLEDWATYCGYERSSNVLPFNKVAA